jgi:hypothetical protein
MIAMDMISHIAAPGGVIDSSSVRLYAEGTVSQGGTASSSRNLQRYVRWVGESYAADFDLYIIPAADRPGRGSDHLSFSGHGYPAVRVIERNEDLAYQHNPNDVVEHLSPTYAKQIAQTTFGALLTMLMAPPRPPSPELSWIGSGIQVSIPDSVALPEGGHFFVSVRNWTSSDFDSISDIEGGREFVFSGAQVWETYAFSISRSNTEGLPSPFSNEALFDVTAVPEQVAHVLPETALNAVPNPFNSEVALEISLAHAGEIRLTVYDLLGREVETLAKGRWEGGVSRIRWRPKELASGIYFATLWTVDGYALKKLLYVR